jgi:hypothetical protein
MSLENPGLPEQESTRRTVIESVREQPALAWIATLRAKSNYERSNEGSPTSKITSQEGKEFSIKTVESGKDPVLDDIQELFEDTFSKEEVDPIETLKNAVDGVTESGALDAPYRVVPVENAEGKLVGVMAGSPLEMKKADGTSTEMVYFVGYAVTHPDARQGGIAKEAYISALMDATSIAQSQGKKLGFAIGECTASSEHYWNSVGWERIYIKSKDSAEYVEVPYVQPGLEFDPATGALTEDAGEAPEHLMIDGFSRKPTKDDIKAAHEAFVRYNSAYPREEFDSDEAFDAKEAYIQGIIETFNNFIDSGEDVLFMDAVTRGTIRQSGFNIVDHYVPGAETADPNDETF